MLRPLFGIVLAVSSLAVPIRAQTKPNSSSSATHNATISGTVTDPKGAATPNASVALLSPAAALEQTRSDDRGQYSFTGLYAGAYRIVALAPGLTAAIEGIQLSDGEARKIDLPLALSAVDQHIVVSASFGALPATQTGSSVTVIGQNEIESHDAQQISEVLREIPGVAINDSGRRGGITSAFIRGGNTNYNSLMLDGIPLNQFGGIFFDLSPLPAAGVAQVEVVRGSQSALYGSNAVTGVINVITQRGEGPPSFSADLEGGSLNTYSLATGGAGGYRGFSWSYELSRLNSAGVVANDNYNNQASFVSLGFSRSPRRQLEFHFLGDANDAGVPGPFGSDPDRLFPGIDTVSRDKQNMFGYQAGDAEQLTGRLRQVTTVSVATNRFLFLSPFGDSFSKNLRVIANTRSEITLAHNDLLVAGFEYNREQFEDTFVAGPDNNPFVLPRTSLAYFVENRWTPNRWSVTTGLRVDDIRTSALPPDAFGERPLLAASSVVQANPRVSLGYLLRQGGPPSALGATRLHASTGTGIRAPDGFELAFTNNPHLKPERSITMDAGVEQRLWSDRMVVDATYFYNRFKDQIVTLGGSFQNLSTFSSDNLANSRAQGLELSARAQAGRDLEISVAYTRLDTGILALDGRTLAQTPFRVGQALIRRPRDSASYDVTWRHGRLRLNTNAYLRGSVLDLEPNDGTFACTIGLPCLLRNKGYVLANAGFAFQLQRNLEIHGELNNFLNQKYEESLGFPALHLNFMAGIRLRIPVERTAARP